MEEQYLRVPQPILYWPRSSGRKASSWVVPHLSKISQARVVATKIYAMYACHEICMNTQIYCTFSSIATEYDETSMMALHHCKHKEHKETERKRGHRYRGSKRALRGRPVPRVDLLENDALPTLHSSQSSKLRRKKEKLLKYTKTARHHGKIKTPQDARTQRAQRKVQWRTPQIQRPRRSLATQTPPIETHQTDSREETNEKATAAATAATAKLRAYNPFRSSGPYFDHRRRRLEFQQKSGGGTWLCCSAGHNLRLRNRSTGEIPTGARKQRCDRGGRAKGITRCRRDKARAKGSQETSWRLGESHVQFPSCGRKEYGCQ
jgi:hypothetical protein